MELDGAMAELPPTYAQALRLRFGGAADPDIATRLDVPSESVGTLIQLAEAKLAALLARPEREPESDAG